MADRTRRRKKKESAEPEKPTKEETAVAKHLRFNLPTKTTSIDGHKVEYFTGSKAVDFLQESKWATGKGNTEILFTDRESVASYLDGLLWKGLFYRALKVVKKAKKEGKEKEGKEKEEGVSKKEKKGKKEKKRTEAEATEKVDEEKETGKGDGGDTAKDGGKEGTPVPKKKDGKKKIKLELTDDQKFVDGNDAFVWVYDPIRPMNYVYGFGLVIGAIAVCLFPLWPPWMRIGTYYLSLCGAGFVGAILALAVLRFILFVMVWCATFGKIHFWLFPNLLADVGIKESFIPFYTCDFVTSSKIDDKDKKTKDDSNGEEGPPDDQEPDREKSRDSEITGTVENILETKALNVTGLSDQGAEADIVEKEGLAGKNGDGLSLGEADEEGEGEEEDEEEVDEVDDDDDEEEEEEEENGDGFEMIDEEEISEVCESIGSSQREEE
ncbi:translocation protein SEC62-like [Diadema setosum]|uniref:translocation protein SEC62-like n=1 Tax=Diadema setosum TaxID=31175 RepID=UPI003B3A5CC0